MTTTIVIALIVIAILGVLFVLLVRPSPEATPVAYVFSPRAPDGGGGEGVPPRNEDPRSVGRSIVPIDGDLLALRKRDTSTVLAGFHDRGSVGRAVKALVRRKQAIEVLTECIEAETKLTAVLAGQAAQGQWISVQADSQRHLLDAETNLGVQLMEERRLNSVARVAASREAAAEKDARPSAKDETGKKEAS